MAANTRGTSEAYRLRVLEEVKRRDPLDPQRVFTEDGAVTPSGEPILRYFASQGASRRALSAPHQVTPEYCQGFAGDVAMRSTQGQPVRVLAMLFDLEMPQIPSVEQQYAIVRAYARHHPGMLWDGWKDTAVQYVRPEMSYPTICRMPVVDYAMHYAFHAAHLAIPSLAFLSSHNDYERLSLLAAGVGKTIAFLDAGIDTLRHPDQLAALAAVSRGAVTSSLSGILGSRLVRSSNGIGWRCDSATQTFLPDMATRTACENLAADFNRLKAANAVIRAPDLLNKHFPTDKFATHHQPALAASSFYLAYRLGFPRGLNITVARALCVYAKLNVLAGDSFDLERARTAYEEIDRRIGESHAALLHARSKRYASEIARILRERYQPTIKAPWVLEGLKECPVAATRLRELPSWLRESDQFAAASEILKSIGARHLREDEELVAAIAKILCQAAETLDPTGRPTEPCDSGSGPSSSTAPTVTVTAFPTRSPMEVAAATTAGR